MYVRCIFLMALCLFAVPARAADAGEVGADEQTVARPVGEEWDLLAGETDGKGPDAEKPLGENSAD